MKKHPSPLLIVIILIAVAEGLYITYPSWSPLLSFLSRPSETATSTPDTASAPSVPKHIDEHAAYYDITTMYPSGTALKASAGATADAKAVAVLKGFVQNEIERFKENGNFANLTPEDIKIQGLDAGRKYVLDISYKTHASPHTLSYVFAIEQDTLGAHPNTFYRTFTFDSVSGSGLVLGDIFTGDYLSMLSKVSRAKLPKVIGSSADADMISAGTTADEENFQTFFLEGKNFVLLFPAYQVGPYALGPVTLSIPLTELSTALKAKYK